MTSKKKPSLELGQIIKFLVIVKLVVAIIRLLLE
jgi:hypothetical protein